MILDGKKTSEMIVKRVAEEVSKLPEPLALAIILVGKDPASQIYVRNKIKACNDAGIESDYYLSENATQGGPANHRGLQGRFSQRNFGAAPLPSHLEQDLIINAIDPKKTLTD